MRGSKDSIFYSKQRVAPPPQRQNATRVDGQPAQTSRPRRTAFRGGAGRGRSVRCRSSAVVRDLESACAAYVLAGACAAGRWERPAAGKVCHARAALLSPTRQSSTLHPPATQPAELAQADAARLDLLRLSGSDVPTTRPSQLATDIQKEIEDLAMQANAASASRQYDRAAELEAAMHREAARLAVRSPGDHRRRHPRATPTVRVWPTASTRPQAPGSRARDQQRPAGR